MGYDSPLFQSALELFAHAIEHFNRGDERDRKFTIRSYDLLYIAHIETRYKEAFRIERRQNE